MTGTASVDGTRTGDVQTLTVRGELIMPTVGYLAAPALAALADRCVRTLVIDLAAVTFMDSTGIGELVSLHATAADVGAQLVLRNPTPRILELFRIIKMDRAFTIEPPPG